MLANYQKWFFMVSGSSKLGDKIIIIYLQKNDKKIAINVLLPPVNLKNFSLLKSENKLKIKIKNMYKKP